MMLRVFESDKLSELYLKCDSDLETKSICVLSYWYDISTKTTAQF